jgi:hypothetical protein
VERRLHTDAYYDMVNVREGVEHSKRSCGGLVWRLATECSDAVVLRTPLSYFRDHFAGRPMMAGWQPPVIDVRGGPRKRLPDFVSWMLSAPVITSKAKLALEPLIAPHAEILPLRAVRKTQLYALNVLTLVDCLDEQASEIVYSPDTPGRIVNVLAFSFKDGCVPDAPIFKLATYPSDVFVTRPFVASTRSAGLVGAAFADPTVNPLPLLMQGRSINVVEGLPE